MPKGIEVFGSIKRGAAMKFAKGFKYSFLALVAVLVFSSEAAWARRHHYHHSHSRARVGVGVGIGVPLLSPFYHSYRPYAYPYYSPYYSSFPYYYGAYAPVVINRAPPVYIERAAVEAASAGMPMPQPVVREQTASNTSWYYCAASKAYYPYVDKCPSGWRKVPSRPEGAR
jgi:hypothetical protein